MFVCTIGNAETTFHMIKSKFGDVVRSKTEVAQVNEVLLKVLCHNICVVIQEMFELGTEPDFFSARFPSLFNQNFVTELLLQRLIPDETFLYAYFDCRGINHVVSSCSKNTGRISFGCRQQSGYSSS